MKTFVIRSTKQLPAIFSWKKEELLAAVVDNSFAIYMRKMAAAKECSVVFSALQNNQKKRKRPWHMPFWLVLTKAFRLKEINESSKYGQCNKSY